ncbi:arylsulfatase [Pedobacter sp. UYP1]|uniref:sulfatase family protein n=1 Tax=Pedobacter sp. UYP1 TaxID=1756396 RepID=UPI0033993310
MKTYYLSVLITLASFITLHAQQKHPNVIVIYADDLGYGDVSCYGAKRIKTPHIDQLAKQGIKFTNAHATSATCTPSRFSILTGVYAWRKKGTGIAPGNAALLIDTAQLTMAKIFKQTGYTTAAIGKWHLGLGGKGGPDWNGDIKPGPQELGFDKTYIIPATLDRVPCVIVADHRVENLDPKDPITVDYYKKTGEWPAGKENPELLTMKSSNGHDNTLINGIGRIGYMTGGKAAIWDDYTLTEKLTAKAESFITANKAKPFFLYFASPNIHVPRTPNKMFAGKSGMGPRGDVILEFDWSVGRLMKTLDSLGIANNTMIVLSSDNGPVIDDGYQDEAAALIGTHKPAGPLRGGKYSAFDGGTRVPFIVSWPSVVKSGKSDALISQVDLVSSFASLLNQKTGTIQAYDSFDMINQLLGKSSTNRPYLIEDADGLGIIVANWKYIAPNNAAAYDYSTKTELGNTKEPQLYNLSSDLEESKNLASQYPDKVKELSKKLQQVKDEHGYHL